VDTVEFETLSNVSTDGLLRIANLRLTELEIIIATIPDGETSRKLKADVAEGRFRIRNIDGRRWRGEADETIRPAVEELVQLLIE
jgi:hypothetical protein